MDATRQRGKACVQNLIVTKAGGRVEVVGGSLVVYLPSILRPSGYNYGQCTQHRLRRSRAITKVYVANDSMGFLTLLRFQVIHQNVQTVLELYFSSCIRQPHSMTTSIPRPYAGPRTGSVVASHDATLKHAHPNELFGTYLADAYL